MFDTFETYTRDLSLLESLGLQPFQGETHQTVHVGIVEFPDGSTIDIAVCGMPAQFFTFTIYCAETQKRYTVKTGSGSLTMYWPMAKAIAEDMLVVTEEDNPS